MNKECVCVFVNKAKISLMEKLLLSIDLEYVLPINISFNGLK